MQQTEIKPPSCNMYNQNGFLRPTSNVRMKGNNTSGTDTTKFKS